MKSKQLANELKKAIETHDGEYPEIIARIVAHVYGVNCNVAGHALRRLVREGVIEVAGTSCAGNKIYRVQKFTTVNPPKIAWRGAPASA